MKDFRRAFGPPWWLLPAKDCRSVFWPPRPSGYLSAICLRQTGPVTREAANVRYDVSQLAPSLRGSYHGDAATINALLSSLDGRLRQPIGLSEDELKTLVAFLKSLTDPSARDLTGVIPASVPSGLPVRE